MKRRPIAAAAAAILFLVCLPLKPAFAGTELSTPEGYNENDYLKLAAFLETADENGVKNGTKLGDGYDPADPATWDGVMWTGDEDNRVGWIFVSDRDLMGVLDLSGCTFLEQLGCSGNRLTGLVITGCTSLEYLSCEGNLFTSLDLTSSPSLPRVGKLSAAGPGTVSAFFELGGWFTVSLYAVPDKAAVFTGWYSVLDGSPVSSEPAITIDPDVLMSGVELPDLTDLEARFAFFGDADGNGRVEAADALIVLRIAMGILPVPDGANAIDVDKSGKVEAADALLILRLAMGIIASFE